MNSTSVYYNVSDLPLAATVFVLWEMSNKAVASVHIEKAG